MSGSLQNGGGGGDGIAANDSTGLAQSGEVQPLIPGSRGSARDLYGAAGLQGQGRGGLGVDSSASDSDAQRPAVRPSISSVASDGLSPRLRREGSRSSEADRVQFLAARREAVQDAVTSRASWSSIRSSMSLFIPIMIPIILFCLHIFVEGMCWYVFFATLEKPCDEPLSYWLLVRNLLYFFTPRLFPRPPTERQQRILALCWFGFVLAYILWLPVGYALAAASKTCVRTNPQLFSWVVFMAINGYVFRLLSLTLPGVVDLTVRFYQVAAARGWIKSPNAASDGAIERMEQVQYSPELFPASQDEENEGLAPSACCCCMCDFDSTKTIVRTPCKHYYHYDCLNEWFQVHRTCPLCRNNLDVRAAPLQPSDREPVVQREVAPEMF